MAEHQKQLFQPFAQEDNSASRRFGGTGLGLALSRQLIELRNGNRISCVTAGGGFAKTKSSHVCRLLSQRSKRSVG